MSNEQIEPRPSVMAFARAMEQVLRKHDGKKGGQNGVNGRTGWRQDPPSALIAHAAEELRELTEAMPLRPRAAEEAVDLGNMAMMVWDAMTLRDDAIDPPAHCEPQQEQPE